MLAYGTALFADPNAGTGKPITVTGIVVGGAAAPNYSYNTSTVSSASITKAPLTVSADAKVRLYGDANPPLTASYSGFVNGQTLATSGVTGTPSLSTTATPFSAAGNYPITIGAGTLASNNYAFSFIDGTLTVSVSGIIGLDQVTLNGGALVDSFDSMNGGYPATSGSAVNVLSNGQITVSASRLNGDAESAAGSIVANGNGGVTGTATAATTIMLSGNATVGTATPNQPSAAIVAPAVAACAPFSTNAAAWLTGKYSYNEKTGDLTVSGGNVATLADGSYCFHSVTLSGGSSLIVNGAVKINVTGTVDASGGSLVNTTLRPANLQVASSYSGKDGVKVSGHSSAYLTVYAPGTDVTFSGGSPFFGALVGKTLTVSGGSALHYDVAVPDAWASIYGF